MARLRTRQSECPGELAAYDLAVWGGGETGVRAWKSACLAWLAEEPGRSLPAGGQLGVLRETVRQLQAI